MVTRMLPVGVAAVLAGLFCVGLSPLSAAQAAYPTSSSYGSQAKRPQFRPWSRAEPQVPTARWRPQAAPASRALTTRNSRPQYTTFATRSTRAFAGSRAQAGQRYAAPQIPMQRPGQVFRPDDRQTQPGDWAARGDASPGWGQLQSQFRPTDNRRKRSYEQVQAAGGGHPMYGARGAGYAVPLPVPPIYRGHWPRW